ncbi:hypothetical protein AB205_0160320, partial [Aquarana catesbeiana]
QSFETRNELCHLTSAMFQLKMQNKDGQENMQHLESRLKEVTKQKEEATATAEKVQNQLHLVEIEKTGWCQAREQLEQDLQTSKTKIEALLLQHRQEKQDLLNGLDESNKQGAKKRDRSPSPELEQEWVEEGEELDAKDSGDGLADESASEESGPEDVRLVSASQSQRLLIQTLTEMLLVVATFQEEVSSLKQEKRSLEEQCHSITRLLKEATDKVNQAEELKVELKEAQEDCHTLKKTQDELRAKLEVSQDQLLEANSKLTLAQSQQIREVQQWKEKVSSYVPKEQLSHLQSRLSEEQQKVQQLQERLRFHAEQTNRQLAMQQEEHERLLRRMEERMQEVEMNLKNLRVMLREKVDQLKEQLEKNAKADILLKDLYVENAQLMKALQVTEHRQKSVEKKNYLLEEKIAALNKVIRKIAPASLAV